MDKDTINKIETLVLDAKKEPTHEINGRLYFSNNNPVLEPVPDSIKVNSLDGLLAFITESPDTEKVLEPLIINVEDECGVSVMGQLQGSFHQRPVLITAKHSPCEFYFAENYDLETFIIKLQTCFIQSPIRDTLIKLLSNIKTTESFQRTDDGLSQEVTVKTAITKVEQMELPNPVELGPYRTFHEIEQPISPFLLRLTKDSHNIYCQLHEADGGMWKKTAVESIRSYLRDNAHEGCIIM